MCVGIAEVVGGILVGWISDIAGRSFTVLLGAAFYASGLTLASLIHYGYLHHPTTVHDVSIFAFLAAFCFGIGDCVANTQTYAILGELFGPQGSVVSFT